MRPAAVLVAASCASAFAFALAAALPLSACSTFSDAEDPPSTPPDAGGTEAAPSNTCTPVTVDPNAPPPCEADLESDPENCGACGRRCVDVTCIGGHCSAEQLTGPLRVIAVDGKTLYSVTEFDIVRADLTQRPVTPEQFFAGVEGVKRMEVYGGELFVSTTKGQVIIRLDTKAQRVNEQVIALGTAKPDGLFFPGAPSYYLAGSTLGGEILARIESVESFESKTAPRFEPVFRTGPDIYWSQALGSGLKIVGPWNATGELANVGGDLEAFFVEDDVAFVAGGGHLYRSARGGAVTPLADEPGTGVAFATKGDDLYYAVRRDSGAQIRYFLYRIDKCRGGRPVLVFDINTPITSIFFIDDDFVMVDTESGIYRVRR